MVNFTVDKMKKLLITALILLSQTAQADANKWAEISAQIGQHQREMIEMRQQNQEPMPFNDDYSERLARRREADQREWDDAQNAAREQNNFNRLMNELSR